MKNLFALLFVLIACKGYAQDTDPNPTKSDVKYSAQDSIVTNAKSQTVQLFGKAKISSAGFEVNANEIIFDKKNNQITAKGLDKYSFDKKLIVSNSTKNRILKYKIGSDTVFIE